MIPTESIARAAARPSTVSERVVAALAAAGIIAAAIARLAGAHAPLGASPQFLAIYATTLALCATFALTLLLFRARLIGDAPSAAIAATFAFCVPLIVGYCLTFPGVAPRAMWAPDASGWMSFGWRLGWPLAVIWYVARGRSGRAGLGPPVAVALLCSAALIAVSFSGHLPPLYAGPLLARPVFVGNGLVIVASAFALVALLRGRRPTTLETWIAVDLVVIMAASVMILFTAGRFSQTADGARLMSVLISVLLAGALLWEFQRLLARTSALDRFLTMARYASTIVYVLDADGACIYVNEQWTEVTGQPADAAAGNGWFEAVHPADRTAVAQSWERSRAQRTRHDAELRYRTADGAYRWHRATATPSLDDRGAFSGWYGTSVDVDSLHRERDDAARLQREAAQRESDIRRIAETMPALAWTADGDWRTTWVNARWYEYTGQKPDAAIGRGWSSVLHPDDVDEVERRLAAAGTGRTPFEHEFRLRGRDGTYRWFLSRALPVSDDAGRTVTWYGTSTDIEDRRRMSERDRALAHTLQTAFLPPFLPRVDGVAFQAVYRPAQRETEIGGDWYDAFVLPDGRVVVSIGDIAGHGVDAAIAMMRLRETFRTVVGIGDPDPAAVLTTAERAFSATHPDKMATCAFALFDPVDRRLTYALAGHPAPALVRGGRVTFLSSDPGVPLGLDVGEVVYAAHDVQLERGDHVAFYTDGLIEMRHDVIADERTFVTVLAAEAPDAEAVVERTLAGDQRDDVALVILSVGVDDPLRWSFATDDVLRARHARAAFRAEIMRRTASPAFAAEAELAFGELLANVVRHAPGPVEVELVIHDDLMELTFRDRGPRLERFGDGLPDDLWAESGRGFHLLARVASRTSVTPRDGGGNEVAVEIPLRVPAAWTIVEV